LALSFWLEPVTRRVQHDTHEPAVNGQSPLANIREPFVKARRHYQISFWSTLAFVVTVLALLPAAIVSMAWELRGQGDTIVYDLFTATGISANEAVAADTAYINVTVTYLDEASRVATLVISGHRVCPAECFPLTGTFYSIDSDVAQRRGLPPSAEVTVPGESGSYTFSLELPIQGAPQLYPFDDYTLLLGLVITTTLPGGQEQVIASPE
jgi:hypothetical protein